MPRRSSFSFPARFACLCALFSLCFLSSAYPKSLPGTELAGNELTEGELKRSEFNLKSVESFSDLYTENSYFASLGSLYSATQMRFGVPSSAFQFFGMGRFEVYANLRLYGDSKTVLEAGPRIFNDSYLFAGLGVDYLFQERGLRLISQWGFSQDLREKILLTGLDYRVGWASFHDLHPFSNAFHTEIYSEGFYFQRYRNFISSLQVRLLYDVLDMRLADGLGGKHPARFQVSPFLTPVATVDSEGLDYNRTGELRVGARFQIGSNFQLGFSPYYSLLKSWSPAQAGATRFGRDEFRVLLNGAFQF